MTRQPNVLTETESTTFSSSCDSGYSQSSVGVLSNTPSLIGSTGGYSSGRRSNDSPYDDSPPNETVDTNVLIRDPSEDDFINRLFEPGNLNETEENDPGCEVAITNYDSTLDDTTMDDTLDLKPKKGTRRSRRKSCTDAKICLVCSDKATGYHFNAMTCEGCKGFFRRSVKNSRRFACAYRNECEITPNNRRKCQACRYNKCVKIGMKSDCVLNDDELEEKRQVIIKNRIKRMKSTTRQPSQMGDDDQREISELLKIFNSSMGKNFSPKFFRCYQNIKTVKKQQKDFYTVQEQMLQDDALLHIKSRSDSRSDVNVNLQYIEHISDIVTTLFYETINFCKQLPDFKRLSESDQICLLRSASWEMMVLQCCQYVNKVTREFTLEDMGYGEYELSKCGLSQALIERLFAFGKTMISINLSKEELVLTYVLIIFCDDRHGLEEGSDVSRTQEKFAFILQQLMNLTKNTQKRSGKNRFPEVIFLLSEARCITFMLRPLLQALNDQFEDILPALMKEMII
jgi:vitamin D3 receptor